ncbi:Guanine nucleotide exchange factor lte1, partial [Coniosporium apollinis]
PVARSATQRARPIPDPFAISPVTIPDNPHAPNDSAVPKTPREESWFSGSATSIPLPHETFNPVAISSEEPGVVNVPSSKPPVHVRSFSCSTIEDSAPPQTADPNTFKVVIERPTIRRPVTAYVGSLPVLQVPIPHYKLGTPRFSARGTAIIGSSVYTRASGTDDFRSSFLSGTEYNRLVATPPRTIRPSLMSSWQPDISVQPAFVRRSIIGAVRARASVVRAKDESVSSAEIGPQVFDGLFAHPDDSSVVRFSNGKLIAATPPRLIVHITSEHFLDYRLLEDFFLTFRSFLSPTDLLAYLAAREEWAHRRDDNIGVIVQIRVFVALRHWIMNFLVVDFVPNYPLRQQFCDFVNRLWKDMSGRRSGGNREAHILGQLKSCWRQVMGRFWEGLDVGAPEDDILPGCNVDSKIPQDVPESAAGSRSHKEVDSRKTKPETQWPKFTGAMNPQDVNRVQSGQQVPHSSLISAQHSSQDYDGLPLSPASEQSLQVYSCSIPMRPFLRSERLSDRPLNPPPALVQTAGTQPSISSSGPQRPAQDHGRSASLGDTYEDRRAASCRAQNLDSGEILSIFPGSLVRGAIFHPDSPYLDIQSHDGMWSIKSSQELGRSNNGRPMSSSKTSLAWNPGVKRLIGSVYRALSVKQNGSYDARSAEQTIQSFTVASPKSSHSVARAAGPQSSAGVQKRKDSRRPQVRVDMLAAKAAESFKAAIAAEANIEEQRQGVSAITNAQAPGESNLDVKDQPDHRETDIARLNSHITTGSRSIVIVDGTGPRDFPGLPGLLAATFLPQSSAQAISSSDQLCHPPSHPRPSLDNQWKFPGSDVNAVQANDNGNFASPAATGPPTHGVSPSRELSKASISASGRRPSFTRNSSTRGLTRKMQSMHSGSIPLRRYASYQSSISRHHPGQSGGTTVGSMSSRSDPFVLDHSPVRPLRRRPGGDLRAMGNGTDAERIPRPRSTGSLSNRTHSVTNSVTYPSHAVDTNTAHAPSEFGKEIDATAEGSTDGAAVPRKRLSLMETHSSQPNLRPSFEAAVARFAALPDDDDDGGVESALMKLEGRYEKRKGAPSPKPVLTDGVYVPKASNTAKLPTGTQATSSERQHMGNITHDRPIEAPIQQSQTSNAETQEASAAQMAQPSGAHTVTQPTVQTRSVAESDDSYSSIPLLERGLSDAGKIKRKKPSPLSKASPQNQHEVVVQEIRNLPTSSGELVGETESIRRIPKGAALPTSATSHLSFLLDENESLADISTELSTEVSDDNEDAGQGVRSFLEDDTPYEELDADFMSHPLRHPPTPPRTMERTIHTPRAAETTFNRAPPTPGLTPTLKPTEHLRAPASAPQPPAAIELTELRGDVVPAAHIPFILAYDAEVLAQQFTIIEKDALDEIEWKELIDLSWKQKAPDVRNWVEYLRFEEPRSVDIVIARFNVMVNWAISECLLIDDLDERVKAIVKYIHIASHARRLQNFATMSQIVLALSSVDMERLTKTWERVPVHECEMLQDLKALVNPLRNFVSLREAMESANTDLGCIPFIGIYTKDLLYNGNKPEYIKDQPANSSGERLVNFERHQAAAGIVKSLSRLLEASDNYKFQPVPEIISKCLWMTALTDEEIKRQGQKIQPSTSHATMGG